MSTRLLGVRCVVVCVESCRVDATVLPTVSTIGICDKLFIESGVIGSCFDRLDAGAFVGGRFPASCRRLGVRCVVVASP